MRKILLIAFSVFLWIGCQPSDTNQNAPNEYFDLEGFVQQLISNQIKGTSYPVTKISSANGVEEESVVATPDSLFWRKELTPLIKADINKPSLKDAYKITDGISEQRSNLQRLVYIALPDTKTEVLRLEIKYLQEVGEARQVVAWVATKNPVYESKQKIDLWVNKYNNNLLIDSLIIKGFNKTLMQDSLMYQTKLIVTH